MSSFENDIQNVFEGAEFQPSDRVWTGIEAALTAKKKKGFFFMWQTYGVAAGLAVIFTFGFLYNDGYFNSNSNLPVKELSKVEGEDNEQETKDPNTKNNDAPKETDAGSNDQLASNKDESELNTADNSRESIKDPISSNTELSSLQAKTENVIPKEGKSEEVTGGNDPVSDMLKPIESVGPFEVLNPSIMVLAEPKPYRNSLAAEMLMFNAKMELEPMMELELASAEKVVPRRADFSGQNSLNGSLGNSVMNLSSTSFSTSAVQAELKDPSNLNALAADVESSEDQAVGAISAGFGFTMDLSRRLSLNLGARYSEFRFRNRSNAYSVEDGRSLPIYAPIGFDSENVFFVGEYDLENTVQSLFLQSTFSYKVVTFGKFDIAVRAGLGLDYFLAYKIKGDLNFLETRKVNPSESDFLNRTNISGVSGLGLNYRLNSQFGISGDISYRRFVTGIGDEVNSSPASVLGFGLSLNYFLTRKEE
ncbi:hypothetical protein [Roseivirga sp. E12]|uniref:hypothetical protein n=1 Tax=Roseivirga sp. E12 TaxID=2819237 RepID=UPI001ABD006D|nr:hypothetical protein [Roseivirga sp. E12]MBO3697644.1 hypothetical protein [Roseivirga sp. E12]